MIIKKNTKKKIFLGQVWTYRIPRIIR